jgi:crossover junction endonuclease MUS81
MERKIEFRLSQQVLPFVVSNVVDALEAPFGRDVERTVFGWVAEGMIGSKSLGYGSVGGGSSAGSSGRLVSENAVAGPSRLGSSPLRNGFGEHSRAQSTGFGSIIPPSSSPSHSQPNAIASSSRLSAPPPAGLCRTSSSSSTRPSSYLSSLLFTVGRSQSSLAIDPYSRQQSYSSSSSSSFIGPSGSAASLSASSAAPEIARPTALTAKHSSRLEMHNPNPSHLIDSDEGHIHQQPGLPPANSSSAPTTGAIIDPLSTVSTSSSINVFVNAPHLQSFDPIFWPSGSYDIILLLDNREIKSKKDRSGILDRLNTVGVAVEQRALPLGDMLWIARRKDGLVEDECVLDFVVERKRLDDLTSSVKDGRFHEQKVRFSAPCHSFPCRNGTSWLMTAFSSFSSACVTRLLLRSSTSSRISITPTRTPLGVR